METKQGEMAKDEAGCRTLLLQRLIQIEPQLIVMEVTGGLETLIVSTLAAAGLPAGRPRAVTVVSASSPRLCQGPGSAGEDRHLGCQGTGAFW